MTSDSPNFGDNTVGKIDNVVVRNPARNDIRSLAQLFSEMQRHYQRPVSDEQAVDAAALACQPVCATFDPHVLIAVVEETVVGSIVLNVMFPAFELSRALYIRDLYVTRSMRRIGVAQLLVKTAAHLTYSKNYSALDWTTETTNTSARRMYEACGARALPRTYFRLAREDIASGVTGPARARGDDL